MCGYLLLVFCILLALLLWRLLVGSTAAILARGILDFSKYFVASLVNFPHFEFFSSKWHTVFSSYCSSCSWPMLQAIFSGSRCSRLFDYRICWQFCHLSLVLLPPPPRHHGPVLQQVVVSVSELSWRHRLVIMVRYCSRF